MKDFLESQLNEIRENKIRFGLLIACLFFVIIFAIYDSYDSGEEINLDAPQEIAKVDTPAQNVSPNKTVAVTSEKVKAVIGANADEIFIADPFKNPTPPAKVDEPANKNVDEKISPPITPAAPMIVTPPVEVPKPPDVKFILRGTALAENKTALIEKISEGKVETLFLQIGDKINGKVIVDITADFVTLDDGDNLYVE